MSLKIGLILSSVRENRIGSDVTNWLLKEMKLVVNDDVHLEIIDLKDYNMPFVGIKPTDKEKETIQAWKDKMIEMDGFVLVTPEYNRMVPGSLANAFQYLFPEVSNKALAFAGYGFAGGTRAITNFRAALSILKLALVQKELNFMAHGDFENLNTKDAKFTPGPWQAGGVKVLVDQLIPWSKALKDVRAGKYDNK